MAKAMSIFGMVVSVLLLLAFLLDLIVQTPFGGFNQGMDIAMLVASACLGYASFDAFRSAG